MAHSLVEFKDVTLWVRAWNLTLCTFCEVESPGAKLRRRLRGLSSGRLEYTSVVVQPAEGQLFLENKKKS